MSFEAKRQLFSWSVIEPSQTTDGIMTDFDESGIATLLAGYAERVEHIAADVATGYVDLLMRSLGMSNETKSINIRSSGKLLGHTWEALIISLFKVTRPDYMPTETINGGRPFDLRLADTLEAIDCKYTLASNGDIGKKLREQSSLLQKLGYAPVLLVLREDASGDMLNVARAAGWRVHVGVGAFAYVRERTGVKLDDILVRRAVSRVAAAAQLKDLSMRPPRRGQLF